MNRLLPLIACVALCACEVATPAGPSPTAAKPEQPAAPSPTRSAAEATARAGAERFIRVAEVMEPAIEAECRKAGTTSACDYQLVIDTRQGQPPNAFQTIVDGQPVIGFTIALILDVRNDDELAFVMAHEGAHHILLHLQRQSQSATQGAAGLGILAAISGADPTTVAQAQRLGAAVGGRVFSKDFELEADRLGARITQRGGFSALRGAEYFRRIPDPGNQFLGTHPPNADRIAVVRDAVR